jgi:hypothetical protein
MENRNKYTSLPKHPQNWNATSNEHDGGGGILAGNMPIFFFFRFATDHGQNWIKKGKPSK